MIMMSMQMPPYPVEAGANFLARRLWLFLHDYAKMARGAKASSRRSPGNVRILTAIDRERSRARLSIEPTRDRNSDALASPPILRHPLLCARFSHHWREPSADTPTMKALRLFRPIR